MVRHLPAKEAASEAPERSSRSHSALCTGDGIETCRALCAGVRKGVQVQLLPCAIYAFSSVGRAPDFFTGDPWVQISPSEL